MPLLRQEMEKLLDTAWVQVVPSIGVEGFGNVTTEAMIRGTAVVASNIGGPAEVVQHGETGLLVPPLDIEALAGALKQVLQNRQLAGQMGRAGREYALKHFNPEKFLYKILQLYKAMISNHSENA